MATELAQLAGRLELDVLSDGRPANPVVVLPLDRWRDAPPALIDRAVVCYGCERSRHQDGKQQVFLDGEDLFAGRIPPHRALLQETLNRHAAGDRHTEAKFERIPQVPPPSLWRVPERDRIRTTV